MSSQGDLHYLKKVSRVKHQILEMYLEPWSWILGSANSRLGYFDCFAGGGVFTDENGQLLPGSPLIALRWAKRYVGKFPSRQLLLGFVEQNHHTAERLRATLAAEPDTPPSIQYRVDEEDAQDYVERLIGRVTQAGPYSRIIPSFFFIDPYGHPITVPVMRRLLGLGKTELLVNLMLFRIHMHIHNPRMQTTIDRLFGHPRWRNERFMRLEGRDDELAFVDYFRKQVGARHSLSFLVHYSPEDPVPGPETRTKFYLIHFSNHRKAALLMKRVMRRASDSIEGLEFSGQEREAIQPSLFSGPTYLASSLLEQFRGRQLTFEDIQIETLDWPYVEKDYRAALKALEREGHVAIRRAKATSKTGLGDQDLVIFP